MPLAQPHSNSPALASIYIVTHVQSVAGAVLTFGCDAISASAVWYPMVLLTVAWGTSRAAWIVQIPLGNWNNVALNMRASRCSSAGALRA